MPLKLVKRHASPFWYLRGSVRGVAVDESTKTADREQAEALRAKREWEIINRQIRGNRAVATFPEAAVSYMENGGEARYVKALIDHFKTTPLFQIGQAEVDACARRACASDHQSQGLHPNQRDHDACRQAQTM
jgi:hypothetical protein